MKMNEATTFDVMFMETIYPWLYGLKNINMLLMKKSPSPKNPCKSCGKQFVYLIKLLLNDFCCICLIINDIIYCFRHRCI